MWNDTQIIIVPTYDDSRAKIALWNDPQIIIVPTYDDSRAKIALWNDTQIIIGPTYDDSRAKIALWNDPQIIREPTYDDSRAKIALWNNTQANIGVELSQQKIAAAHDESQIGNIYWLLLKYILGARCSSVCKSVSSWCNGSSDRSFMVDPFDLFLISASAPRLVLTKAVVCAVLYVGWCM